MFPNNFRWIPSLRFTRALLLLLGCAVSSQHALAQSSLPQTTPSNKSDSPGVPSQIAPDAAVITINGFCAGGGSQKDAQACSTKVSKQQFSEMLAAMSFNSALSNNPVAIKAFAESYAQAMIVADAAEKSGLDKDPQFEALMKIIRVRTLADTYRRKLQQKNSNPSGDQIESYYKQNAAKFDQIDLDRISIPLGNPKLAKEAQDGFRQKAQTLANEARLRMTTGEDPGKVQAETYRALGLTPPLTTDLGTKRKGSLPSALEQELFALKTGEVSKVQADPSSLTLYKIRSRSTLPLDRVRMEVAQEIQQKEIQAAMQAITGGIKIDFNDQYFKPHASPNGARTNAGGVKSPPLQ
jgi:hypothetical protein